MNIKKIKLQNFRNIEKMELCPSDKVNIIFGKNAQGKTNILEAIWLFSGAKSQRTTKEQEFIKISAPFFRNELDFFDGERDNNVKITLSDKKDITYNGIKGKTTRFLAGKFNAVMFVPSDLLFVSGSPILRRRFLDGVICQLKPSYIDLIHQYHRVLLSRNQILKDIKKSSELFGVLEAYDVELSKKGTEIIKERIKFLEELSSIAAKFYKGISKEKEEMGCVYISTLNSEISEENYYKALKENRNIDLKNQTTSIGPHRDDIDIFINSLSARKYASQGQQRSIILTLKLAEGELIKKKTGRNPVFLLDDVMSELDEARQDFILNHVKENQVFITCCDISSVLRLFEGKIFEISDGKIINEKIK